MERMIDNCGNIEEHIADADKMIEPNINNETSETLIKLEKSEWEHDHEVLRAYSDGAKEMLDKIRTEIAEYGSIWVAYTISGHSDGDIERLIAEVLRQAKEQVLDVIDKYKAGSEGI